MRVAWNSYTHNSPFRFLHYRAVTFSMNSAENINYSMLFKFSVAWPSADETPVLRTLAGGGGGVLVPSFCSVICEGSNAF